MAIDEGQIQDALRTKMKTLVVCTTGSTTLGATGATFTRSSGSFKDDGFKAGMEGTPSGFTGTNNNSAVIIQVEDLVLTVNRTLATEGASAGRTIQVGLPSRRAWENVSFNPDDGSPYIQEEFLPGPTTQISTGLDGWLESLPMYVVKVSTPQGYGVGAINGYSTALRTLFKPGTVMTLDSGDFLRVRADMAPFRGQLLNRVPGWATAPISIPCRLETRNV